MSRRKSWALPRRKRCKADEGGMLLSKAGTPSEKKKNSIDVAVWKETGGAAGGSRGGGGGRGRRRKRSVNEVGEVRALKWSQFEQAETVKGHIRTYLLSHKVWERHCGCRRVVVLLLLLDSPRSLWAAPSLGFSGAGLDSGRGQGGWGVGGVIRGLVVTLASSQVVHEATACNWSSKRVCQPDSEPSLGKYSRWHACHRNDLIGCLERALNQQQGTEWVTKNNESMICWILLLWQVLLLLWWEKDFLFLFVVLAFDLWWWFQLCPIIQLDDSAHDSALACRYCHLLAR